ncbi:MAG TPA: response regulator [Thermoanaerobaculia bacterium]|nr:response regulator [Thermoanaerobaculia bacterium]
MTEQPVEILFVEDNPHDVEMTMRALRKHNLVNRMLHVGDGAAALDYLFARGAYEGRNIEEIPRAVFLDLKLPKVDGIEVLRAIKSDERLREVPVVIITSSAEERDRVESYRLGVNSYIVKPIVFESFARTIAEVGYYWVAVNRSAR